jgi:hypothetical protein
VLQADGGMDLLTFYKAKGCLIGGTEVGFGDTKGLSFGSELKSRLRTSICKSGFGLVAGL